MGKCIKHAHWLMLSPNCTHGVLPEQESVQADQQQSWIDLAAWAERIVVSEVVLVYAFTLEPLP